MTAVPDLAAVDVEAYAERVRAALAQRRELAQAATAGPWQADRGTVTTKNAWIVQSQSKNWQPDAAFIAANDPAHVLALLDQQETAVGLALDGLRRHQPTRTNGWCRAGLDCGAHPHHVRQRECPDALAWWSVLTGIGTTYGVTG